MIEKEPIKLGQTVWFDNGGQIESGCLFAYSTGPMGSITCCVKKTPDSKGFSPLLEGWEDCNLYGTRLACLRAMSRRADKNVDELGDKYLAAEKRSNELAAQIKAEEAKPQIPKAKLCVMRGNEAFVQLPDYLHLNCGYMKSDGFPNLMPTTLYTNQILIRYAYLAQAPNPHTCYIFAVGDCGKPFGNKPHKFIDVSSRMGNVIQRDDIRAAVKELGFELED